MISRLRYFRDLFWICRETLSKHAI